MKKNDRIRAYAAQIGVPSSGAFKNSTTTNKLVGKLTPAQKKRLRLKQHAPAPA